MRWLLRRLLNVCQMLGTGLGLEAQSDSWDCWGSAADLAAALDSVAPRI